jgi:hypothetical protein
MLPRSHPIRINMAQCWLVCKICTCPIPTATGKKPKLKKQSNPQRWMGWEKLRPPILIKRKKQTLSNQPTAKFLEIENFYLT